MNIEEKDIITLDDNNDYSVVRIIELPSKKVYFLAYLSNLNNQKYMYLKSDDKLVEIQDKKIINELEEIIKNDTNKINDSINEAITTIDELINEEE